MNALRLAPLALVATLGLTGCAAEYYESGGQTSFAQGGVGYNAEGQNVTEPPPPATTTVIGADGTAQEVVLGSEEDEYVDTDPTALTEFRTTLDPYGTWVDDGTYGTVWMPAETVVGADFAPYVSAGHWAYADDYVWVSDYDWGWAPFHYGRWVYITGRGWAWIPGRTYAGAWVSWRVGGAGYGYVGWGPMAPTWYWRGGMAVGLGYYPPTPYTFCSTGDLFHPAIRGRVLAGPQVQTVATNTRPWVPASPGVGGGQGGPGRAPATPQVGGPKVGPGGRIFGPPPGTLGLAPHVVPPPPTGEKGLLRAQAFARPSTAVQAGARAPAGFAGASSRPTPIDYPRAPRDRTVVVQGGPQTYSGPRPVQAPPPSVTQGQGGYHPPPSYTPPPSQGQGQVYRTPPPSYSPPPQVQQAPAYRPSPPPQVQQAPAYRPSPPPQVQQRPSAPPPQVHQAPPPAPRGGGSFRR
jgi:hypothetical protein